jgi:hypothetical protein
MPKIASNFELGSAQPIDSRLVVDNESNLSSLIVYEGLEVYVKSLKTKKMYDGSGWVEVKTTLKAGTGISISEDGTISLNLDIAEGSAF